MASSSLIEIVNAALVTLGQEPIQSLDNTDTVSSTVTQVRAVVNMCKRKLLRSNDWNCARVTTKLNKIAGYENKYGWQYAYALPTVPECLRVVQISLDEGQTFIDVDYYYNHNAGPKESLFDIDANKIFLCNYDNAYIKYTADIDPAKFDAALADAFAAQLAAELAYALPASAALADYREKVARRKLKEARSLNARERNIGRPEGDVISVRYTGLGRNLRVDMSDEAEDG